MARGTTLARESDNFMSSVSIVIPVHGRWDLTRPCLESLAAHLPGDEDIVLVDNGSWDETPEAAPGLGRSLFPDRFAYHAMESNAGFARACNRGAELAGGELVMFLNNDTFTEHDFLTPLIEALENTPDLGAAGALLLYPDTGRVQHCGIATVCGPRLSYFFHAFPPDHPAVSRPRLVSFLTGAALLVSRQLFGELGGFDESYTNGYEDMDLCCALSARGLKLACEPRARLYHHTSATPGRWATETANKALFDTRWGPFITPDLDDILVDSGYEMQFNEWLQPHPVVPDSRRLELITWLRREGIGALPSVLDTEPCLGEAWDMLATSQKAIGDVEGMIRSRFLKSVLCPGVEALQSYEQAVREAGLEEPAAQARDMRLSGLEPSRLKERETMARRHLQTCRRLGKDRLAAAYADWLSRFAPAGHGQPAP
jgi:GT2 family glycosyltransferase